MRKVSKGPEQTKVANGFWFELNLWTFDFLTWNFINIYFLTPSIDIKNTYDIILKNIF